MKTRLDVITRALRTINVCAYDEAPEAAHYDNADEVLQGLFAEVPECPFNLDEVPNESFVPLANWLGAELAGQYGKAGDIKRSRLRFLATVRRDDREDFRDTDKDGLVSTAEYDAGERARFY